MLKSSILISLITKFLLWLNRLYEGSVFHAFFKGVGGVLRFLWEGSSVRSSVQKEQIVLGSSLSFRIVKGIFRGVNTIITWFRERIFPVTKESVLFQILRYFNTSDTLSGAVGTLFIGFSLGMLVVFLRSGRMFALPVAVVSLILGFLFSGLAKNFQEKIRGSALIRGLSNLVPLVLTDEEAEQWKF